MDWQYYPTPPALAKRMWAKFTSRNISRLLEPSAGEGHLLRANDVDETRVDVCEIDPSKHAVLRAHGYQVVGLDFLQFGDGSCFSHILLNPPFRHAELHVLKAWDILWDGEVVACIGAHTLRRPDSKAKTRLSELIERCGEVEFVEEAFSCDEASRKTTVEVAIIHLVKRSNFQTDVTGNLFADLRVDDATLESMAHGLSQEQMLALPNSVIENAVLAFNAAKLALKEAAFAEAKAAYYCQLLGDSMTKRESGDEMEGPVSPISAIRKRIHVGYLDLKGRAWTAVLKSSEVKDMVSAKAQAELAKEFEQIKMLEFTPQTIHGFLCGLAAKQNEIQTEMLLDVFDEFMKYHSGNVVFYRGWRSNDRHRTCGMRLRAKRIVMPLNPSYGHLSREAIARLSDFDKVFAMLDGKHKPEVTLESLFLLHLGKLEAGERLSSTYFDARYFKGIGTAHLFPKDPELVDKLNRHVGRLRNWIPPNVTDVEDGFWKQYGAAEKLDREIRQEIDALSRNHRNYVDEDWLSRALRGLEEESGRERANKIVDQATEAVLRRHHIPVGNWLEHGRQQLLIAA